MLNSCVFSTVMKFPANEKKDEAKMDAGIEEDFAKELLGMKHVK